MFVYLYCGGVDFKLLKDGEGFFVQFVANGDVGDVRGIVIVQTVDVLHDPLAVRFNGCQYQQILEVSRVERSVFLVKTSKMCTREVNYL